MDGLRALAVASVVMFHLELGVKAGYLGVSLFFTISGYLISRQILDLHRADVWSWSGFAAKRVRRLAPMATVTLLGVVALEVVQPFFWGRDDVGGDSIAASLNVANWWFISGARGYDASTAFPSPVQHYWSLSVEEQFYVFLPLLMIGCVTLAARRNLSLRKVALWAAGSLAASSAVAGIAFGGERAYFGTDTRAVELLAGVAGGVAAHYGMLQAPKGRRAISLALPPLLGALIAVWVFAPSTTDWMFRGWLIPLALGSAVIVVAAGEGIASGRWLGNAALVSVGRRSYSLYLVHWPVLLATGPRTIEGSDFKRWLIRIVLIIALTEVGFRWVESPIRRLRGFGGARLGFTYCLAIVCFLAFALPTLPAGGGTDQAGVPGLPLDVAARFDREGELARIGRRPEMLPDPDPDLPAMVIRGDSTARFVGGPLSYYAPTMGLRTVNLGAPSCVIGGPTNSDTEAECPTLADDEVVARRLNPRLVVFTFGVADMYFLANTDPAEFRRRLTDEVQIYRDADALVVLVRPWPEPTWKQTDDAQRATQDELHEQVQLELKQLADRVPGAVYTEGGGLFDGAQRDDRALRPDGVHIYDQKLGREVIRSTLGPALEQALTEASGEL